MSTIKDSYELFVSDFQINREQFLKWGIDNTIYPKEELLNSFWDDLKSRIKNKKQVFIRGRGNNGKGNDLLIAFYEYFGFNAKIDANRNSKPTQNLQLLTGEIKGSKKATLMNFQVSHIFGRTSNIFMFESPWNICFVPKIFDPLTGHESRGMLQEEYKNKWIGFVKTKYKKYIDDFNNLMISFDIKSKLDCFFEKCQFAINYDSIKAKKFKEDMIREFSLL